MKMLSIILGLITFSSHAALIPIEEARELLSKRYVVCKVSEKDSVSAERQVGTVDFVSETISLVTPSSVETFKLEYIDLVPQSGNSLYIRFAGESMKNPGKQISLGSAKLKRNARVLPSKSGAIHLTTGRMTLSSPARCSVKD